jgi:hypothetical protein
MGAYTECWVCLEDANDPGRVVDWQTETEFRGRRIFTGNGAEDKANRLAYQLNGKGAEFMPINLRAKVEFHTIAT